MNTDENYTDLEQLFTRASQTEPQFLDQQFTSAVLDGLAAPTTLELVAKPRNSLFMDVAAAALGFTAVSYFVDLQQAFAFAIDLVPESVVINPMAVLVALLGMTSLSVVSWWVMEQR